MLLKGPKKTILWPSTGLVASKWWNSVEQGGNKSGHTKFNVMEPFSGSGMPIGESGGPQNGQRGQKGLSDNPTLARPTLKGSSTKKISIA